MNIQTDGYEEEGEYLHGRDTFNYFSDIFHISHGPHEGEKYQDLITNSNTLSKKIFYFFVFYTFLTASFTLIQFQNGEWFA